jgi:hypothetical protein
MAAPSRIYNGNAMGRDNNAGRGLDQIAVECNVVIITGHSNVSDDDSEDERRSEQIGRIKRP